MGALCRRASFQVIPPMCIRLFVQSGCNLFTVEVTGCLRKAETPSQEKDSRNSQNTAQTKTSGKVHVFVFFTFVFLGIKVNVQRSKFSGQSGPAFVL